MSTLPDDAFDALDHDEEIATDVERAFIPYTARSRHMQANLAAGMTPEQSHEHAKDMVDRRYGGQPTAEDVDKRPDRYARLLRLGATEEQARRGSRDIGAFNAARIYLRAK